VVHSDEYSFIFIEIVLFYLQEILPSHQPRFIVYAYKMIHNDRISYPLCFIFYTPRDSKVWRKNICKYIQWVLDSSKIYR